MEGENQALEKLVKEGIKAKNHTFGSLQKLKRKVAKEFGISVSH